jgi:copper resistance protein D
MLYQLSVYVHILGAMVWVGGMLFLSLVAVPVARRLPPPERARLLDAIGRRFRVVGWSCVALLIATGIVNSGYRGVTWGSLASGAILDTTFGRLLCLKLLIVAAMLAITALHDLVIGPRSTRALSETSPDAPITAGRRTMRWLAVLALLLALLVVAVASMLVRGLPW